MLKIPRDLGFCFELLTTDQNKTLDLWKLEKLPIWRKKKKKDMYVSSEVMIALHKHIAWKSGKEFQMKEKHHLFSVTVNTFLPLSLFKSLDRSLKPSLLLQHYIALCTLVL